MVGSYSDVSQVTLYMVPTYIVNAVERLPVGERLDIDLSKKLVDSQFRLVNVVDNPVPKLLDFVAPGFFQPRLLDECLHRLNKRNLCERLQRRRRRRRRIAESRDRWPVSKVSNNHFKRMCWRCHN